MIEITLTDEGCKPLTLKVESIEDVQKPLTGFNMHFTQAQVSINDKNYWAWRFLGDRVWYSMNAELGLKYPDSKHTFLEWYKYERGL